MSITNSFVNGVSPTTTSARPSAAARSRPSPPPPGELPKHAVSEGTEAVSKHTSSKSCSTPKIDNNMHNTRSSSNGNIYLPSLNNNPTQSFCDYTQDPSSGIAYHNTSVNCRNMSHTDITWANVFNILWSKSLVTLHQMCGHFFWAWSRRESSEPMPTQSCTTEPRYHIRYSLRRRVNSASAWEYRLTISLQSESWSST